MKSSRMKFTAVLLTAAFTLTGCGDALYVLTPEEETAIVSYAARAVAKYNSYQQDGEVFVLQEILDGEDTLQEEESEMPEEAATEEPQETEVQTEQTPETDMPSSDSAQTATLTDALDLGVIQADYVGSSLSNTYEESDYYAVDADAGMQFLVVNVNLTNPTEQDLHVDILAMTPTFQAVVNGTDTAAAQTTILLNDLSTYQSDVLAGATNETVLLFQIPQEIQEISGIQLKIDMNGNHYVVNL